MNLFYSLINNINQRIINLQIDYIGQFDLSPFLIFISNIFILLIYFIFTFIVGGKIHNLISKKKDIPYALPLNIALGYIFIGSLFSLLGFFSVLKQEIILLMLSVLVLVTLYPTNLFTKSILQLKFELKDLFSIVYLNKLLFFTITVFALLALINLVNPEIREDQYHVDLSRIFLREKTTMIALREDLHVSASPLLAEMYNTVPILLIGKEAARYLHFGFYILCVISLISFIKLKKYKFAFLLPIVFVTSPVIIHETSSAYTDFQWVLCLLSTIILLQLNKKINIKTIILMGLLLGGMISSKLWTIVLIPPLLVYLAYKLNKQNSLNTARPLTVIIFVIIFVSCIWFVRAYILTGNPLYPAFLNEVRLNHTIEKYSVPSYFTINTYLINPLKTLNVFSPLFFIGLLLAVFKIKLAIRIFTKSSIFILVFLVFIVYLFINYPYGRYLLGSYVLTIFVSSLGLSYIKNQKLIYVAVFSIFLYYFINSILVLPYAFNIANQNKYLTRILSQDNSSYYDFDKNFDKYINVNDKVAMYNFHGYYYADFNFVDVNYIFNINNKSIEILKKYGVNKLMIRGGDIQWFCERINLKDCKSNSYSLISSYQQYPYYYLYNIDNDRSL